MEKKILSILCDINEDIAQYHGESLYEDGYLDSFQVIMLVSKLEDEFDIEIDPEKVILENFESIGRIALLVRECQNS